MRRPGRTLYTILGVALAVGSLTTLVSLSRGMEEGTHTSLQERGIDLVVTRKGAIEIFGAPLPESLEKNILALPGVADVSGELGSIVPVNEIQPAFLVGWGEREFNTRGVPLLRGRRPILGAREVVIGEALAQSLHSDVGATLSIDYHPGYKVVGVAQYESGILKGMVVMHLREMQHLLGRAGEVTVFQVRSSNPGDATALKKLKRDIESLSRDVVANTTDATLRSNRIIGLVSSASLAIGLVALLMSGLNLLNTIGMAVEERTREIGILSAVGWSRRQILVLILCEGTVLAAFGGIIGVVLGRFATILLTSTILAGSDLSLTSSTQLAIEAEIAAIFLGVLSAAGPALRASKMIPAKALMRQ